MARAYDDIDESNLGFHLISRSDGRPISLEQARELMADAISDIVYEIKGDDDDFDGSSLFGKGGNPAKRDSYQRLFLEDVNMLGIDGLYGKARQRAGIVVVRDGVVAEEDPRPIEREPIDEDPTGDEDPTNGGRRRKSPRRKRSSKTRGGVRKTRKSSPRRKLKTRRSSPRRKY